MSLVKSKTVLVSIIGTTSGCGATHLALSLATYYANVFKRRVAICELSAHKSLDYIVDSRFNLRSGGMGVGRITFFTQSDTGELSSILKDNYDIVFLDISSEYEAHYKEIVLSSHRLILFNLCPWQVHSVYRFLSDSGNAILGTESTYLYTFGHLDKSYNLSKWIAKPLIRIPFEENPFHLHSDHVGFYNKITQIIAK